MEKKKKAVKKGDSNKSDPDANQDTEDTSQEKLEKNKERLEEIEKRLNEIDKKTEPKEKARKKEKVKQKEEQEPEEEQDLEEQEKEKEEEEEEEPTSKSGKEKKKPEPQQSRQQQKNPNQPPVEQYDFKTREKECLDLWEKENVYKFSPKHPGKIFSIDTPPPTVSGTMHIGHACSYTHHDFIARFKRMQGFNVFFPWGMDDNGLPTERYVEKKLNVKASSMSRQEFIDLCLKETKEVEEDLKKQWMSIGFSPDYSMAYRTIDTVARTLSQWSFIELFKKDRAYRKECPVLWCPECHTAISQVELKDKEESTVFNDLVFKIANDFGKPGTEEIIVATTRPEFLPACVAIFYHPKDERYKHLKFKKAVVPLFNFLVPILEDERVDMNKGTGIVMCCTFGDQTDMDWWRAYGLPYKKLITAEGLLTDIAEKYKGMKIKDARVKIINDLKEKKLVKKQQKIKHMVNVHERCGTEIEIIVAKQWFIKYLDLKEKFLELGQDVNWHPEYMKSRYENWIKGLQWDWCISRQRYFGVPFPVWYCKQCDEVIVANEKKLPVDPSEDKPPIDRCPKCESKEFVAEKDILDTWATSSMTPDIAIATAEMQHKKLFKKLYPFSLRPQAHDIITFWAFNTIVKAYFHHNSKPWDNIMISGYVLLGKEKMSKSKGNTIEPMEYLAKYGMDALRYWASTSKLGEDVMFDEKEFIAATRLVKKLWNAFNFFKIHLENRPSKPWRLEKVDEYLLLELDKTIKECTNYLENYEYSHARACVEKFFWQIFCDNYLEIIKGRIYGQDKEKKASAQYTVYQTFLNVIKLFAPIMPCITEEIYQSFFKTYERYPSIHISRWPETTIKKFGREQETLEKQGQEMFKVLEEVRKVKAKAQKSMKAEIILTIKKETKDIIAGMLDDLKSVVNAQDIKEGEFDVKFV